MKQTIYSKATFPIQLLEDVDKLNLSSKERDKVISFLVAIKSKSLSEKKRPDSFVEIPSLFLRRNFGENYTVNFIDKLVSQGVVKVCNSYSYGNVSTLDNFCKRYSLNNKYYLLSYMWSNFDVTFCKSTKYCFKIDKKDDLDSTPETTKTTMDIVPNTIHEVVVNNGVKAIEITNARTKKKRKSLKAEIANIKVNKRTEKPTELDLKSLKIDFKKLRSIIESEIDASLLKVKYHLNDSITTTYFNSVEFFNGKKDFIYNKKENRKYEMRLSVAKEKAEKYGLDLIEYKGKLYIMKEEHFLNLRRNAKINACNDGINELESRAFRAVRSGVNGRLNTNITNLPSFITKEIMRQNKLVQLDLANSQFTIFAHLFKDRLSKHEDFKAFAKHAQEGNLYEFIQESLGLGSRAEAKQTMFELMFARIAIKSPLKAKLKEIFPNVVKGIDEYKKEHCYNMFAVELQRAESEIFIDGILTEAQSKKIFCLTKHDSIIIRERDLDRAKKIVDNHFNKIGFIGTIKQD